MLPELVNPPTALVLAIDEVEADARSLLGQQLQMLRDLGLRQFVVVCRPVAHDGVVTLARELGIRLVAAALEDELSIPAALVAAEPALAQIAAGPIYVTQPQATVLRLHAEMLRQWMARPSGVDGLIAATAASEPGRQLYVELNGERVISIVESNAESAGGLAMAGPVLYAQARELCETVGDERDLSGSEGAYARALSRLAYWYEFRHLLYEDALT